MQSFLWITVPKFGKNNQLYRKTGLFEVPVPKNSLLKSSKSARELESASELDLESEPRARARASLRAGGRASSLARQKFEVVQLALARSPKNQGKPARARSLAEIFASILHSDLAILAYLAILAILAYLANF